LEVTRNFSASMYLMWKSATSGSIPVPLGYVTWSWYGDAKQTNTTTHAWSLQSSPTNRSASAFHPTTTTQSFNGYPTWTTKSTKSCQ
jgi:hypothetical protein